MSVHSLKEFLVAASSDPVVGREFVASVGDKSGDEAVKAVAAYAAGQGYDVTAADAEAVRVRFAANADGALDNSQLEAVAGGFSDTFFSDVGRALDGAANHASSATQHTSTAVNIVAREVTAFFSKW